MTSARLALSTLVAGLLLSCGTGLHAELATWTNLDGATMRAEFLGRKGDYVSFRQEDGSRYLYPYANLSAEDRVRVDALTRPASEIAAETEAGSATAASASASPSPAASAPAGKLAANLSGKLVAVKGKSLASVPGNQLDGARYIAVYYSAHWCPPCRGFTPELVKAYKQIKAKHPEFEIVFVSGDRTEDAMQGYMTEYNMEWPAVRFKDRRSLRALGRPSHERGIPNLVFMDADGKDLSTSYTADGQYRGPRAVLADIKKHFRM